MSQAGPLQDVRAFLALPLLREHWYVAGLSEEFGRRLLAKTVLERSVVFYRKQEGELVALQNRCAHRAFPLAESQLVGDRVRCGYHGIVYEADGAIAHVPCQTTRPRGGVRRYPVAERGPFAWIWMGDPEAADPARIPELGGLGQPGWRCFTGEKRLEGSYLLMQENLADLSHFAALHASSLNVPSDWVFPELPVEVERQEQRVDSWRATTHWNDVARFFFGTDLAGRHVQVRIGSSFLSPGMVTGYNRAVVEDAAPGEQQSYATEFNHYLTPETRTTAHYYYSVARNCGPQDASVDELLAKAVGRVFDEDVFATAALQRLLDEDGSDVTDLNLASDRSGLAVRRVLVELAERESVARPG
jgi:vanillate O-demethylase monooxygenase subunit